MIIVKVVRIGFHNGIMLVRFKKNRFRTGRIDLPRAYRIFKGRDNRNKKCKFMTGKAFALTYSRHLIFF